MSKDPWVKFFPTDFLSGVAGLSAAERGVYITLLASMYDHAGPIKRDDGRLGRLCGLPTPGFTRAVESLIESRKLVQSDGWLFNERVKIQLHERENRKLTASDNAKSRWEKPKQIQGQKIADGMREASQTDAMRASESELESEKSKNPVAVATSSTQVVDLFSRQAKKLERVESDQHVLDQVTDVWNAFAVKNRLPQVQFLTGQRAVKCRQRLKDITNGGGPIVAFEGVLAKCAESFFVKGSPRNPLRFNQLLDEKFFVEMMEDGYRYNPTESRGGTWRR